MHESIWTRFKFLLKATRVTAQLPPVVSGLSGTSGLVSETQRRDSDQKAKFVAETHQRIAKYDIDEIVTLQCVELSSLLDLSERRHVQGGSDDASDESIDPSLNRVRVGKRIVVQARHQAGVHRAFLSLLRYRDQVDVTDHKQMLRLSVLDPISVFGYESVVCRVVSDSPITLMGECEVSFGNENPFVRLGRLLRLLWSAKSISRESPATSVVSDTMLEQIFDEALSRQPDATLRFDELLYHLRWKLQYMAPPPPLWSTVSTFAGRAARSCFTVLTQLHRSSRTAPTKVTTVMSKCSPSESGSFAWDSSASRTGRPRMSDRQIQVEVGLIMQRRD